MRRILLLFVSTFLLISSSYAQLTTSEMKGKVGNASESMPGATVILVHQSTGSQYATITNENGHYILPNLQPGGPYNLKVSFVGYQDFVKNDIFLTLGQTLNYNVELSEGTTNLEEVTVVAFNSGVFDGNTTGSKTTVSRENIAVMPTISRGISDFARLTPQAKVNSSGGLEIAGQSNRYNSFTIDGAVQNDVFGLAASGTNGGQVGINPMSIDIIDQITISLSPYDVTQSGFAGAGINAVTKSGTNRLEATAYNFFRNQNLAGLTPTDDEDLERKKLDEFKTNIYGLSVGGPIVKDKLFFFTNIEIQRESTPRPFDFSTYTGSATRTQLDALSSLLNNTYSYDPGGYENVTSTLDGEKIFFKLDWNINDAHKFSIRHQYSKGHSISPSTSSTSTINFANSGVDFISTTNSTTAELNSRFGSKYANKLRAVVTIVDDNREPMGAKFPYLAFTDERVNLGSEQFSTANRLKQTVFSLTDNFNIYAGNHNLTIGMHHEYYNMFNVFIRQNYGSYVYQTIDDFINGNPYTRYNRSFSAVDNVTGDDTKAAAEFKVLQLGFYVQDDFQVTDKFNLTGGIRVDFPMYMDQPSENADFNNNVIPYLVSTYNVDMMGAKTGKAPKTNPLFSPRIGFNWDINGDKTMQLRGGAGLFTSRIPYVWPGGMYNNNGITVGGMDQSSPSAPASFISAWNNQPSISGDPSGQIDLFAEDFKMPQVFRANLAFDKKLPYGINSTFDFTFTKNVNNVTYQNLFVHNSGQTLEGTGDNRIVWENIQNDVNNNSGASGNYNGGVYLGSNTSEGHSFNFMTQFDKTWDFGLYASLAYNYSNAKSINDGESSQNSSQWRVVNGNGRNNLSLGNSIYDLGHRVVGNISYKINYSKFANTTISLFYNGQSGSRYSYGYNDRVFGGPGADNIDGRDLSLMYVPKDQNDIVLVDDGTYTAAQQWTDLNAFINDDKYLSDHRGEVVERHSQRLPFEHIFDFKIMQEFKFKVSAERENKLQISFDVFNLGNMLNKDWGRMHYSLGDYNNYQVLSFQGYQPGTYIPTYTYYNKLGKDTWNIDDSGLQSSRWQAQIGIRYIF